MLKPEQTKVAPRGMSVPATAAYMDVSVSTVWRMLADGTLPRKKLRRRTVIDRDACDALLAKTA